MIDMVKNENLKKEAQGPSAKEADKIYDIEKTMALTIFKKYYPDASIVFNEPQPIEEVVIEEGPSEEELLAIKEAEEKAAKKSALEAELAALDDES